MALEDLKDKLRESFQGVAAQVQESTAWMQLMEKYQNLSPNGQKGALAGIAFVFTMILFLIPWVFYSSSQTLVTDFEDKQDLIRQTFKVKRETSALPPAPPPVASSSLTSSARNAATNLRLQPEQIVSITELPASSIVGVPKTLDQAGVIVTLAKLNLTQIVDIGHELQLVHPLARLTGLEVKAVPKTKPDDPHYFDVTYRLVAISIKPDAKPEDRAKGQKK